MVRVQARSCQYPTKPSPCVAVFAHMGPTVLGGMMYSRKLLLLH